MGGLLAGALTAGLTGAIRWLRVAQREHYLFPAATRFARRWWTSSGANAAMLAAAAASAVAVWWAPVWGWPAVVVSAAGPLGLGWRGTSSPLVWTGRLRRLALATGLIYAALAVVGFARQQPGWLVAAAVAQPLVVDAALLLTRPIEARQSRRWVERARKRLRSSGARVVAITGSYGKTSTKEYVRHLLSGEYRTVASPASFNNLLGLARAINEHLAGGTEIFVAEMGTYGRGEIAELCRLAPPEVAVITAIGPVHLERFGSLDEVLAAKSEILEGASKAIVNGDDPMLARLEAGAGGPAEIVFVSTSDVNAPVAVVAGELWIAGSRVGAAPPAALPANLACAVAVALHYGVDRSQVAARLDSLPAVAHRREVKAGVGGVHIVDDTYNSNPAGAMAALDLLAAVGEGRRVVVTPGMVELGRRQDPENRRLAGEVVRRGMELVIVGKTNRRALRQGAEEAGGTFTVVGSRREAVDWVRSHLGEGDAVLYENDLPDHYP
jgi:UDP-N-acetylmuramoyl-tripeptide--D-alanyl-D-alanine ligase